MKKYYIIAIDGPAGTGKSTISRLVSNKINFAFIKTGEMYRGITYKMLKDNIDLNDIEQIDAMLNNIDIKFKYTTEMQITILDGIDITDKLSTPEVSAIVSQVAANKSIRNKVYKFELEAAENNNIIMEGRDIGTTVFPHADVKIFLTASVEERAHRRYKQSMANGHTTSYEEIKQNIEFRDENDRKKEVGALKIAEDAIMVDNTNRTIESVVAEIVKIINDKIGDNI